MNWAEMQEKTPVLEVSNLNVKQGKLCGYRRRQLHNQQRRLRWHSWSQWRWQNNSSFGHPKYYSSNKRNHSTLWSRHRVLFPLGESCLCFSDAVNFDSHFPLTVRELVALGRVNSSNLGRTLKRTDWEAVDEVLEFMGISDIANRRIGQLSGGQKQRVFVAKALVRKPEIILLDEPIVGVDAKTQEKFYKKLSDLNLKKGITIMLVTHDLTAVFCQNVQGYVHKPIG